METGLSHREGASVIQKRLFDDLDWVFRYTLSGFMALAIVWFVDGGMFDEAGNRTENQHSILMKLHEEAGNNWWLVLFLTVAAGAALFALSNLTVVQIGTILARKRILKQDGSIEVSCFRYDFPKWRRRLLNPKGKYKDHLAVQRGMDRWNSMDHSAYGTAVAAILIPILYLIARRPMIDWWLGIWVLAALLFGFGYWSSYRCFMIEVAFTDKYPLPDIPWEDRDIHKDGATPATDAR